MDEINFQPEVTNPANAVNSFVQGYAGGAALRDDQAAQAQKQVELQQQVQQKQVLQDLVSNPNAGAADYAKATALLPATMREQLKQSYEMLNTDQQQNALSTVSQMYSAATSGQPEVAAALADKTVAGMKASGADPKKIQEWETLAQMTRDHPEFAKTLFGIRLSTIPGGDKIVDNISKMNTVQQSQDEAPASLAKKEAEASSAGADAATKNLNAVAARAGALAKPGVKATQAVSFFRSMGAQGLIPKDDVQGYIDDIPADPKDIPAYLKQIQSSGISADKQMEYTTPSANTVANNRTQIQVQNMVAARQAASGGGGSSGGSRGMSGLSTQQNEALFGENGAVTTGRLDPNRLNSRTAGLLADAFIKNPNIDMAKTSGDIALGRNATFRQNAMTA
ncbi:MAG: hypothetical protein ACRYGK_15475, partial [Janthinobacterium lividum]